MDAAHGPDINTCPVDLSPKKELRGSVADGHDGFRKPPDRAPKETGQAKICNFNHPLGCHEQIIGFEILAKSHGADC